MLKSDNMGGFISADFITLDKINFISVYKTHCRIGFKANCDWISLDSKRNGITIKVTPDKAEAGLSYTISGSVHIKSNCESLSILPLYSEILLRLQTPDGQCRVFGTDQYPLKITLTQLTPSTPSGFSGYELSFSGKQLTMPAFTDI